VVSFKLFLKQTLQVIPQKHKGFYKTILIKVCHNIGNTRQKWIISGHIKPTNIEMWRCRKQEQTIMRKKIESVIKKNLPTKKTPGPSGFTVKLYLDVSHQENERQKPCIWSLQLM
jgi:hypothetical protein